jgi:CDGSH-type Zn-finger protein/uncharacterized Fe-S cluster protein YjdI
MEEDVHEYRGEDIDVSYDRNRCIHVRACVEGLPGVFDTDRRPWVSPDGAGADEVATVIERCPTGALHYDRTDGGPSEAVPKTNVVTAVADGPLYLRGDVVLRTEDDGTLLDDTRVALCRCGHTGNLPLCDGSHERVFEAAGVPPADARTVSLDAEGKAPRDEPDDEGPGSGADERLAVTATRNGPLELDGPFVLQYGDANPTRLDGATLCRCGGSGNKPFCDGTHAEIGFSTDD